MAKPMRINVHTYIFYIHYAFNIIVCVYRYICMMIVLFMYMVSVPFNQFWNAITGHQTFESWETTPIFLCSCHNVRSEKNVGRDSHSGLWPSLRGPNIGCRFFGDLFFYYFFVCVSVWGTFPCYLLHFGAKTCTFAEFWS